MGRNALLVAIFALPSLLAQTDTSSLSGQITDPAGASVPHAQVLLRNLATTAERRAVSREDGQFLFTVLAPGRYEMGVQAAGFKVFRDADFEVRVAQAEHIDVRLTVGQATETVEVQGTVEVLLNSMGGFSASGGRTNNNAFLLDGVTNLDPNYNSLSYMPIANTLAEFQVQTSQLSAEYGRASGAHVNVVTKSGSNEWHASGWEFLRNQVLDARPFNSVSPDLAKFQRNQFGATLGAPIRKNKLFVFRAFERLSLRQAAAGLTTVVVPTPLERQGDFSGPNEKIIYDADAGRTPFPGNRIPAARLNTLAAAAANRMPAANVPGTGNQFVNGGEVLQQDANNAPQFRNAGGVTGSENSPPQDSYNLRAERGPASFDNKFRWVNTMVWDLPIGKGHRLLPAGAAAAILSHWQVAGIVTGQTGFPFTVNVSGDTAGIGGGSGGILIRANPVPGQDAELPASQRSAQRWFNTNAFAAPPAYAFGTLGRNTLIGPALLHGCDAEPALADRGTVPGPASGGGFQPAEHAELWPARADFEQRRLDKP